LEENTIQRPLGEKLCQEFMSGVLQFIFLAWPPFRNLSAVPSRMQHRRFGGPVKGVVPYMLVAGASVLIVAAVMVRFVTQHRPPAAVAIDYPADGAIFPPEITAPTFLWRDPDRKAAV